MYVVPRLSLVRERLGTRLGTRPSSILCGTTIVVHHQIVVFEVTWHFVFLFLVIQGVENPLSILNPYFEPCTLFHVSSATCTVIYLSTSIGAAPCGLMSEQSTPCKKRKTGLKFMHDVCRAQNN
jgi:hypothetical protein